MNKYVKKFLGKPNPWRLGLLLLIMAVCAVHLVNKRRTESALVADSSELARAVWELAALLPEGEADPATTPRRLQAVLPDGRSLAVDMDFSDPLSAWPARLTLTWRPDEPRHADHRRLEIRPPFDAPAVFSPDNGGGQAAPPADLKAAAADINALKERLEGSWPRLEAFTWRNVAPGCDTAEVPLRYGVRMGSRSMRVVRLDPALYDFKPYHERDFNIAGERDGLNIAGWQSRLTPAVALINGGQYFENRDYIGVLRRDGRYLSAKAHKSWSGYLVSGPRPEAPAGAPLAAVLDMELGKDLKPGHFDNVMQSLMLFDAAGQIRVNRSFYLASRAGIGQDGQGRIWLIMTPGAISLHDWAVVLRDPAFGLVRALCLDGGFEAQLAQKTPEGQSETFTAEYLVFPTETVYAKGIFRSLPSVIAAEPRAAQ